MSVIRRVVDASPEAVWAVLSDPLVYAEWVVGAKVIRHADPQWPAVGAALHHTVGAGPAEVKDATTVTEVEEGRRLRLRARARPLGVASVELRLRAADRGCTDVEMIESVVEPVLLRLLNPLFDPLISLRNRESLRRLERLARARPVQRP